MNNEQLEWARRYVKRGWPIFLLGHNKRPMPNCDECAYQRGGTCWKWENCQHLTCHAFYAATTDVNRVEEMLGRNPNGMLALRTGSASGLAALDAEGHGEPSGLTVLDHWNQIMLTEWSPPMLTLTQRTGSGGVHLLYRLNGAPLTSKIRLRKMPIDLKAEGGYIALAMGAGDGRHWENWDDEPADIPKDMVDWLQWTKGTGGGGGGTTGDDPEDYSFHEILKIGRVPDGQRDSFFRDLLFKLVNTPGMTYEMLVAQAYDWWAHKTDQVEDGAQWEMPWESVIKKLDYTWAKFQPPVLPDWRPTEAVVVGGTVGAEIPHGESGEKPPQEPPAPPAPPGPPTEVREPEPTPHGGFTTRTDTGNGERFARLMKGRVRYSAEESRWYIWDGNRWQVDTMNHVMYLTKDVILDIRAQAALEEDGGERDRLVTWALQSESMGRRRSMLEAASSEPGIAVELARLDAKPWQLVVKNGTLDLREGVLRESRPEDLNTRCADVSYDPGAECPLWERHVEFMMQGNQAMIAFIRRVCGYSLTGLVSEQKFFFLYGEGQNGKNVFVETLAGLLGEYGAVAQSGLISAGEGDHPTALASLRGARLVMADETEKGKKLNDARVKMITGSKKVRARYMRQDFFEYDSTMKLWILGNNKPKITDSSAGMWRRMKLIECGAKIPDDQKILNYDEILRAEWPGILRWSLEGLRDWQSIGGLGVPEQVDRSTAEYRQEEDMIGQFIEETLREAKPDEEPVPVKAVYILYKSWCEQNGVPKHEILPSNRLGTELHRWTKFTIESDVKRIGPNKKSMRVYPGVALVDGQQAWVVMQNFA